MSLERYASFLCGETMQRTFRVLRVILKGLFYGYEIKLWMALYDDLGRRHRKNKRAKTMLRQGRVVLGCLANKALICGQIEFVT